MITINTINNSWYFIGSFVIEPNTSATYDETTLSQRQARDLILAFKAKRVFISYTDLDKLYIVRDGSLPPGGSSGASGDLSTKQDVLVSGTNIKTINGNSVLGSGNLVIAGGSGGVDSVQGRIGAVVINKADVGLSNVNNTSDLSKPVSTATQNALNLKANSSHTHVISEVTNLTTELNSLSGSDILSGAISGNNLVLTLKNNNTINIDVTQFVADLTVVSGSYDSLTESIIFQLSDLSTFSVPVSSLLPVTTDGVTIKGNGGSTSLSVKIDTGPDNRIIVGAGGLRTDSILSNTTESYTTSDKNLVNDIPSIKNDILTKQNTLIPGANIDITSNVISVVGLGAGNTNLSVNRSNTAVTVTSDTGDDAIIAAATTSLAGVMVASDKVKLDGIATGATVNSTDAQLRDRATHTGTQLSTTISDLTETIQDTLSTTLVAGTNVSLNYNDTAGTLTVNALGAGGTHTTSATPPVSPNLNDTWYDTSTETLFMRVNDGSGALWLDISSTGGAPTPIPRVVVFNASGTFIPSLGARYHEYEAQAAGGGGGGTATTGASQVAVAQGGTGGAFSKGKILNLTSNLAITIGGAGNGATAASNGGSGSNASATTIVGTNVDISCGGGLGGNGGTAVLNGDGKNNTQLGGTVVITGSSVASEININGGENSTSGGITSPAMAQGGAGGSSAKGFGGQYSYAYANGTVIPGRAAVGFGSGGGGSIAATNAVAGAGANGRAGIVIITEYF